MKPSILSLLVHNAGREMIKLLALDLLHKDVTESHAIDTSITEYARI